MFGNSLRPYIERRHGELRLRRRQQSLDEASLQHVEFIVDPRVHLLSLDQWQRASNLNGMVETVDLGQQPLPPRDVVDRQRKLNSFSNTSNAALEPLLTDPLGQRRDMPRQRAVGLQLRGPLQRWLRGLRQLLNHGRKREQSFDCVDCSLNIGLLGSTSRHDPTVEADR